MNDTAKSVTAELSKRLSETTSETLEHLSGFARNSQLQAIFAGNVHLANWFQALNKVVREEIRHRAGDEQQQPADATTLLDQRTRELSDDELEAVGLGFATIVSGEAKGEDVSDNLRAAIEAAYDPIRREYLRRSVASGGAGKA